MPNFTKMGYKHIFTSVINSWYLYIESNDNHFSNLIKDNRVMVVFMKINMTFIKETVPKSQHYRTRSIDLQCHM